MKTCFDLIGKFGHCDSCHEDYEEFGYDMPEISVNGELYLVCCEIFKQQEEVE